MRKASGILLIVLLASFSSTAQESHNHGVPEKLGTVSFPVSCSPKAGEDFDRGVALLHSFGYRAAETVFRSVAEADPHCAMAHWGIAMSYFHQLWEPALVPATIPTGLKAVQKAQQIGTRSVRERKFIDALALIYKDADTVPYRTRAANYEQAMRGLASQFKEDVEVQVFYALALLANASPADKAHEKQKQAADVLEPLYPKVPQQPGIPHYLIHAYDNAELAARGLPFAKVYSQVAPSAPHALHMPSHIFTRLGLWPDSISSNLAAREAAKAQGDIGEEMHAMDYLVYAYLQGGREAEAGQVVQQLQKMSNLNASEFKAAYASTAMPVRYIVERGQWAEAANLDPPSEGPPQVIAIAIWARGMGLARSARATFAHGEIYKLRSLEQGLRASGNDYWATQVKILAGEVSAWCAQAEGKKDDAVTLMRAAADEEDAIEKLPVTPGPIIPAREQLGTLFIEQGDSAKAAKEFEAALKDAPGRQGALQGLAKAEAISTNRAPKTR
ncbi:MAG TPA: hypothetical protein VLL05_07510 [Terriglobales bacterium]|nr:hypothetical protein [Terriglobales bacterium]